MLTQVDSNSTSSNVGTAVVDERRAMVLLLFRSIDWKTRLINKHY